MSTNASLEGKKIESNTENILNVSGISPTTTEKSERESEKNG
jgi:hypothetical protein